MLLGKIRKISKIIPYPKVYILPRIAFVYFRVLEEICNSCKFVQK